MFEELDERVESLGSKYVIFVSELLGFSLTCENSLIHHETLLFNNLNPVDSGIKRADATM